jgi:hypothetical protein
MPEWPNGGQPATEVTVLDNAKSADPFGDEIPF